MKQPPVIPPPPVIPGLAQGNLASHGSRGASGQQSLLNLEELERFKSIVIFAKSMVEGYFSGIHKSPYHGASAEFCDYKEYVPGEDTAKIDWRVYGRTRRLFVRQFEEETDMVVYVLVDTSASMRYSGAGRQPKFFLAAKIAAALCYLMIHQGDKAALALFSNKIERFVPPGGTRTHMHRLVSELERVRPASTTGVAQAVSECNMVFKKRGRLVVVSDFLDDTASLFEALGQFMHRRFEILLLHVLDRDELHLPELNVARFVDLETAQQVELEPQEIRASYRERMRGFVDTLSREADQRQITYQLIDTEVPYLQAIEAYLGFRHGLHSVR